MDFQKLLSDLKSGAVKGASRFDLRNEAKQTRADNSKFQKVKREKNKLARLLLITDIALPFDPIVGETTDEYNFDKKFRLEVSATTTIKTLKAICNEDKELKEKNMRLLGVNGDWDTSNPEVVTSEDFKIFDKFRVPRVFSQEVIAITSKTLHNNDFSNPYVTNFSRDEFGNITDETGEYPQVLRLADMYKSIYFEKHAKWLEANKNATDKEKREQFKAHMNLVPVTNPKPMNTALVFELGLDSSCNIVNVNTLTAEEISKGIKFIGFGGEVRDRVTEIRTKYKDKRDKYVSFYEMDMSVGDEDEAGMRASNTKFQNAEVPIDSLDEETRTKLLIAIDEAIDNLTKQEERILASVVRRKVDSKTISNVVEALSNDIPFESVEALLTDKIGDRYSKELSSIYGDQADDFLMDLEDGDAKKSIVSDTEMKKLDIDMKQMLEETEMIDDDGDDE